MKKYIITVNTQDADELRKVNEYISISSLFQLGVTITTDTLHAGVNRVTDPRVIESVKQYIDENPGACEVFEVKPYTPTRVTVQALRRIGRRVVLLLACAAVLVSTFAVFVGFLNVSLHVLDVLNVTGNMRFVCMLLLMLFPCLEIAINFEVNACAAIARIFRGAFNSPVVFGVFSVWKRIFSGN